MATKRSNDFGVKWFIPKRKRPVFSTTVASSDLAVLLVEEGASTFREIGERALYDQDLKELVKVMDKYGYADKPIELAADMHGIIFV